MEDAHVDRLEEACTVYQTQSNRLINRLFTDRRGILDELIAAWSSECELAHLVGRASDLDALKQLVAQHHVQRAAVRDDAWVQMLRRFQGERAGDEDECCPFS